MDNETMNITSAVFAPLGEEDEKPFSVQIVVDGVTMSVPMDPRNRHYKEILRQTEAKTLVIQNA